MQILSYLIIIIIGVLIGSRVTLNEKFSNKLMLFQDLCLLFLLFVMGYKIGSNDKILGSLKQIGIESFIIASLCIVFSIIFTKIGVKILGGNHDR